MSKLRIAYSQEAADQIVAFVRSGGFPEVAAEAAMIPVEVYQEWIVRGEKKKAREPYRTFALRIRQAIAHARLTAEIDAKEKDPRFWLLHGPGRETEFRRGWTKETRPLVANTLGTDVLGTAQGQAFMLMLLQLLSPFPEARQAIAAALFGQHRPQPPLPAELQIIEQDPAGSEKAAHKSI